MGHRSQSADDGQRGPPAAWLLRWLGGAYRCVSESVPPRRGTDFDAPLTGSLSLYALRAPPVWPMSSPAAPGRLPAWPRTTDNGGRRPRGFCGGLAAPIDSHRGAFLRGAAWPLTRLLRDGRTLRQGVPSLGSSIVASPVRAISRPCAAQGGTTSSTLLRTPLRKVERALPERHYTVVREGIDSGRLTNRDVLHERLGRLRLECSRVARAYSVRVTGDGRTLSLAWTKDEQEAAWMRQTDCA